MSFTTLLLPALLTLQAADSAELRREALMAVLRRGGYTVLLRHARTDRSFNEVREYVPRERAAQRNLNDDGIRDAALMGVVFRKHGIAFAEVVSSPMYRTVETAEYSVGKPTATTMALRVFPATPEQAALVMKRPKAGTNRLLVTHHFVIETHVPGVTPGYIGESEAAVVEHTRDGKVRLIGRITLDDWRQLANPGQPAQATSTAASSQQAPVHGVALTGVTPGSDIPDSHAGHIAREYIAAFNSGNPETMRGFLEAWVVADPHRTTDERLASYRTLFEEHGPMTVTSLHDSQQTLLTLGMRSKRGTFRLTVRSSDADPMRATSVAFAYLEGAHR